MSISTGTRRAPTDVVGVPTETPHLAGLNDQGTLLTWTVHAWAVDGRPMVYIQSTGRLVPFDATDLELHDLDDDQLMGCRRCEALKIRARNTIQAVDS